MKKYELVIGGTVVMVYDSKEEAEKGLYDARHSFLAMVHPKDCMYIKEK